MQCSSNENTGIHNSSYFHQKIVNLSKFRSTNLSINELLHYQIQVTDSIQHDLDKQEMNHIYYLDKV